MIQHYGSRYLTHHGILGQKWGIRRYQNEDGTLTAEGKARYYHDVATKHIGGSKAHKREVISDFNKQFSDDVTSTSEVRAALNSASEAQKTFEERYSEFDGQYGNNALNRKIFSEVLEIASDEDYGMDKLAIAVPNILNNSDTYYDNLGFTTRCAMIKLSEDDPKQLDNLTGSADGYTQSIKDTISSIIDAFEGQQGGTVFTKLDKKNLAVNAVNNVVKNVGNHDTHYITAADAIGEFGRTLDTTGELDVKGYKKLYDDTDKLFPQSLNYFKTEGAQYGWPRYFSAAIYKLGYDETPISEMSESDWKKIDSKIYEMQKENVRPFSG